MIDKVGYAPPVNKARAAARVNKQGASGFASALQAASETAPTHEMEETASLAGVGSLLGFQEVDERDVERRKAYKHGKMTLDVLSQLRDSLLMGTLPIATIEKLERLVAAERAQVTDPLLKSILDEIELRAAVEIAKLEVASGRTYS